MRNSQAIVSAVAIAIFVGESSGASAQDFGPSLLDIRSGVGEIVVGELSGDGRNDIVCIDDSHRGVSVLLSQGRGHFAPAVQVSVPNQPSLYLWDLGLGDFDQDGDVDVLALSSVPLSATLYAFRNDGGGAFAIETVLVFTSRAYSFDLGDLNNDGRADLVVAVGFPQSINVFLATAGGGFAASSSVPMINSANAADLAVADLNGDGQRDVVTANGSSAPTITTLFGNGSGSLGPPTNLAAPTASYKLALGRWNAGSTPDLALAGSNGSLQLMDNPGNGAFVANGAPLGAGSTVNGLATGDFNGDGFADLVCTRSLSQLVLLTGAGNGTFAAHALPSAGNGDITLADVDGDALDDLVFPLPTRDHVQVLTGANGAEFGNARLHKEPSGSFAFATGDLNGDGRIDVVLGTNGAVSVRLGQAAGGFASAAAYAVGVGDTLAVTLGHIDGDPDLDALLFSSTSGSRVLLGDGLGGFGAPVLPGLTYFAVSQLADLSGDGLADFAYVNSSSGRRLAVGNGAGGFSEVFVANVAAQAQTAVAGDWNEDGLDDFAFWGTTISVYLSTGGGAFTGPGVIAVPASATRPRAIDVNSDGHLDLLGAMTTGGGTALLLGDGTGQFVAQPLIGNTSAIESVAADLDGDGDLDLAAVDVYSRAHSFRGDGAGNFVADARLGVLGTSGGSIAAIEATGDGRLDLLTSHSNLAGFLLLPNLGPVAPAVSYCTAKLTSNGCTPAISASGISSASATSGFVVACANAINNKNGLFFYSFSGRRAVPFQGGVLCSVPPSARTPLQSSAGNAGPNDCSGAFSIDLNAFAHGLAGGAPQPALLVQGAAVTGQWWGRDPAAAVPTMLSNAIEFLVGP